MPVPPPPPPPPRRLSKAPAAVLAEGVVIGDKYHLERQLGQGGMGEVWRARHVQLGRRVAIKFLRARVMKQSGVRERFLREARAAATLMSDHIAQVFDVGEAPDGVPYMVMEFLEGRDVESVVQERGTLAVAEVVDVLQQACAGVAVAHAAGIVHRDLKPANLFLVPRPHNTHLVKVLDFGIAKTIEGQTEPGISARSLPGGALSIVTSDEVVLGSAHYMAPEQMESAHAVDHRADLWSLGVIAYRLLTGRYPFDGERFEQLFAAVHATRPVPLWVLRPEVPPGLAGAIDRCLQPDPAKRWPSVAALQDVLRRPGSPVVAPVEWASRSAAPASRPAGATTSAISFEPGPPSARGRASVPPPPVPNTSRPPAPGAARKPVEGDTLPPPSGAVSAASLTPPPPPIPVSTRPSAPGVAVSTRPSAPGGPASARGTVPPPPPIPGASIPPPPPVPGASIPPPPPVPPPASTYDSALSQRPATPLVRPAPGPGPAAPAPTRKGTSWSLGEWAGVALMSLVAVGAVGLVMHRSMNRAGAPGAVGTLVASPGQGLDPALPARDVHHVEPLDLLPFATEKARSIDPSAALRAVLVSGAGRGEVDLGAMTSSVRYLFDTPGDVGHRVLVDVVAPGRFRAIKLAQRDRSPAAPAPAPRCTLARAWEAASALERPRSWGPATYALRKPGAWALAATTDKGEVVVEVDGQTCEARRAPAAP